MEEPCAVVGFMRTKPDRLKELKGIMLSVVDKARNEDGCLGYELHQDQNDPGLLVFYEIWNSAEDMERHSAQPYLRELMHGRMDYLERDIRIHRLSVESPPPCSR